MFSLISFIIGLTISAQEYEVACFDVEKTDLTARTNPRIDSNGRKCAVIKVYANDKIAEARGSVIGDIKSTGMEKLIYIAHDSKQVELIFENHYPLKIIFMDYDIPSVTGQMTYICKLRNKASQEYGYGNDKPAQTTQTQKTNVISQPPSALEKTNRIQPKDESGVPLHTPLPLNPEVRYGELSNGLSYYILHNGQSPHKANFYLTQKVGCSLESPQELGFSHFLEHMAFNGTRHFPGNSLLEFLRDNGLSFGTDINAYTSVDETIYMINNVPSNDRSLTGKVLLALRDWSCDMTLADNDIESERGVIEEEWRVTDNPSMRMLKKVIPEVYTEFQYQHMPMGDIKVVRNFKPQMLRDYYKKWFRPDLQCIVVVGDIDVDEMEKQIQTVMGDIPVPSNPIERKYVSVSDNKEPIYSYFSDAELPYSQIMVFFKTDAIPFENRNSLEAFRTKTFEFLLPYLINKRLNEFAKTPDCRYSAAGVTMGHFLTSSNKDAFQINIIPRDNIDAALSHAMDVVGRACQAGFSEIEIEEAHKALLASYSQEIRDNNQLGNMLNRHFLENDPILHPDSVYDMIKNLSSSACNVVNDVAKHLLTSDNQVVVVAEKEQIGKSKTTKSELLDIINTKLNAVY